MDIKRNIILTLESRKKDRVLIAENVPIRTRVNFAPKRIEFTTGYRIDATKWGYIDIADDIKANAMSKFNQL